MDSTWLLAPFTQLAVLWPALPELTVSLQLSRLEAVRASPRRRLFHFLRTKEASFASRM